MPAQDDARWMRLALSLGARGLGRTWPNPAVGCVIVAGGRVLGRGWTQPGGRPHAEAMALAQAGAAARGATAYVTLEPCAHQGRGAPCAGALAGAGLARVVTATEDPDPRTAGAGHAILRAAGIAVETGCLAHEALRAHRGFLMRVSRGRPMVTLKLALSLDGRIATASGESRWITGAAARARVHALRASHDAVLVGSGTARADDPALTVRGLGVAAQPVRVVFDSRLSHAPDSALGRSAREVPVWMVHTAAAPEAARQAWEAAGARLIGCGEGTLDAAAALSALGAAGLTRVFCEGGGQLAASLMRADAVDEVIGFSAGLALGGDGRASLGPLGLRHLAEAPRFRLVAAAQVGADLMHRWERA